MCRRGSFPSGSLTIPACEEVIGVGTIDGPPNPPFCWRTPAADTFTEVVLKDWLETG